MLINQWQALEKKKGKEKRSGELEAKRKHFHERKPFTRFENLFRSQKRALAGAYWNVAVIWAVMIDGIKNLQ